jgi:hypothetical protein
MSTQDSLADAAKRGHEVLGQHAANQAAIGEAFAARNAQAAASGSTTPMFFGTPKEIAAQRAASAKGIPLLSPAMDKMKPGNLPKNVPTGMSGGRVAAIVAGVALAGGALYALTRKKEPKPEMGEWTNRVNAERSSQQAGMSLDR